MKEYLIKKDRNRSGFDKLVLGIRSIKAFIKFDQSCLSTAEKYPAYAAHRVVGFTNGWSYQFFIGWAARNEKIDVYGCFRISEAQFETHLITVNTGKIFQLKCSVSQAGLCCFDVDAGDGRNFYQQEIPYFFDVGFGFKLGPKLFRRTAPQDLKIEISWV